MIALLNRWSVLSSIVLVLMLMQGCDSNESPSSASTEGDMAWVLEGPIAWAEHFAVPESSDADGFPAASQLSRWSMENPADAVPAGEKVGWAVRYSEMIDQVVRCQGWSAELVLDKELLVYGERTGVGIGNDSTVATNKQLLAISKNAEPAIEALREAGRSEEARNLAHAMLALGERLGRNGASEEHFIATVQVSLGSKAVRQLSAIAAAKEDESEAMRLEEIQSGIREYGKRMLQRRLGDG